MFRKLNSSFVRRIINRTKIKENYIVFESAEHHIYDNSYCLFSYLRKYKKLKLFYVIYDKKQYSECYKKGLKKSQILLISNRIHIHSIFNLFYIIRSRKILKSCSLIFISYRNFYKEFKIPVEERQKIINLRHGQFPIKEVTDYYSGLCINSRENTFFRVGTNNSIKLLPKSLTELPCQWFGAGMPRNDNINDNKMPNLCKLIGKNFNYGFDKLILCMTTFKNNSKDLYFKTQFPIKITNDELEILNEYLKENNIYFLIKTHHDNVLHDEDRQLVNFSNIFVKDSIDFDNAQVFSSQLFKYSNGLITDYSSVLFDYLLVNKPVGFAIGDFDKYSKERGFSLAFSKCVCGPTFDNFDGLMNFVKEIANGVDNFSDKRKEISLLFNGEPKESYCKEICDLFISPSLLK